MKNIFLDTNVLLDIFLQREPFLNDSQGVFKLVELKKCRGFVSSLSFQTIYYVLSRAAGEQNVLNKLRRIRNVLAVSKVDQKIIDLSLSSDFKDFEDAIQYFSALSSKSNYLITRNKKDFKNSAIPVLMPFEFLHILP